MHGHTNIKQMYVFVYVCNVIDSGFFTDFEDIGNIFLQNVTIVCTVT
jgi:hypothetical protein